MGFLLLVDALAHEGERGECKRDDDARENPEEAPPSPRIDEQAAEQRPDIGREPERDAGDAHGRRVLPGRKARHGDRLHDRQHDAVLIACSTRAASNMAKPGARAATRAPAPT